MQHVKSSTAKKAKKKPAEGAEHAIIDFSDTKYELSLAEFPIFFLSTKIPAGIESINYSDTIHPKGKVLERNWTVTWSRQYGPPTQSTAETFFALYQIWNEDGYKSPWIHFNTIAKILKRKGVARSSQSHNRIVQDLYILRNISINAKNAFYDRVEKKYIDANFNLFDNLIIEKDNPGAPDPKSKGYIKANQFLHSAAKNNSFLLGIPEEKFFKLPSLQQRLYVHLQKMFRIYTTYMRNLNDLAAQLPLHTSERKMRYEIKQASIALRDSGLIPSFADFEIIKKDGKSIIKYKQIESEQLSLFSNEKVVEAKEREEQKQSRTDYNFMMITDYCKDTHSYPFYRAVAAKMETEDIYQALSETKDFCRRAGKGFTPKMFTSRIMAIAQERGISIQSLVEAEKRMAGDE